MLASGFARKGKMDDDPIFLFRTGPFIPPISFPSRRTVVNDRFRSQLEESSLFGLGYREVIKHHIAKIGWESWDRTALSPERLPNGGEPEEYVLAHWHSYSAAREMGEIWELLLPEGAITSSKRIPRSKHGRSHHEVMVDPNSWDGNNFFRSKNQGHRIASSTAAKWLRDHCGDWISLEQCIPWAPID